MDLEETTNSVGPADDRAKVEPPPPVRLVAVADMALPAIAGLERELDALYVGVLEFERDPTEPGICYRAENFRLRFLMEEGPIQREDYRAVGVQVKSLEVVEMKLREIGVECQRVKSLWSGIEMLVLQDAAGNWIEIGEVRSLT